MKQDSIFEGFIKGLDKATQATLAFYLQKDLLLRNFANSAEMKKLKAEITQDVLDSISIHIENNHAVINPETCKGCTLCAKKCPANAVSGNVKEPHTIDQNTCIKCGQCITLCKFNSISVE